MAACKWPVMLLALFFSATPAGAQDISLIRDAEIESMIRDFARPIWTVAGLDPNHVEVNLVQDKSLNAFVAGGQRIFINTGTITAADRPNEIIGVLAHETGHITGGHLARTQDAIRSASNVAIVSMLAGLAAIAAGGGDAGAAILLSSPNFAARNFLAYSRTQESSADQAGLSFLEKSGQSGKGLVDFFRILATEENLKEVDQDPYVRSHPLTRDRITTLERQAKQSPYYDVKDTPENIEKLKRAKAKIIGYLEPKLALQKYKADDPSPEARYARAFAYYRESLADDALTLINGLLKESPDDPYYNELKAQILFESGHPEAAGEAIAKAISILPKESLFRIYYGQILLAEGEPDNARTAITQLTAAARVEKEDPGMWAMLAQAYHIVGNQPMADLSTAEQYLLTGQTPAAVQLASRALKGLERNTPSWWRAQDIVYVAQSNGIGRGEDRRRNRDNE